MMALETGDVSFVIGDVNWGLECIGRYHVDAHVHVCSNVDHDVVQMGHKQTRSRHLQFLNLLPCAKSDF